ncbi:MAG: response regulator, partial [Acidobacteria bacterium]|nr:response regulator [Acidobacteriota bacterium]
KGGLKMPLRILVVDDNRDTLRTYVKALEKKLKAKKWDQNIPKIFNDGLLEVDDADTVSIALKKLKGQLFEILVVDLKIPGLSGEELGGLDLISESLKLDPLRPIIAITGYGSIELARRTLTHGVFDFIEKSDTAIDELINAVQRAIDLQKEKVLHSGNPFTPMTGIEPTFFGGRSSELDFFEQKLNRAIHTRFCEHFLVLGNWGIGKSTLLKEYKKICQNRGNLVTIAPLEPFQVGASLPDAARSIVESILRGLPYPIERFKKISSYLDSIGFTILGTGLQFGRDTSKKDISPQAFLHDTLLNLWKDMKDKTEVLVVLLDDLDNLLPVSEIVMTLKSTLSMDSLMETKILFGIASTMDGWLQLTSIKKHHPLSRYFLSRVELNTLEKTELKDTILKSILRTGVSFSQDVISQVYEYTQGHPFEMQVLCYQLFNNQISRRVDIDIWEKALQTAIKDMGLAIFDNWLNQASPEERKVLRIVAEKEAPILPKDICLLAERNKIKITSQNVRKYLQRLMEKKLINKLDHSFYTIPDRMFQAYIRSYSALT